MSIDGMNLKQADGINSLFEGNLLRHWRHIMLLHPFGKGLSSSTFQKAWLYPGFICNIPSLVNYLPIFEQNINLRI